MIRVAVIGVGHWHAPRHIAALARAGARVVGVSDPDVSVAERGGSQLGCPFFDDDRALVERVRPDFVFALPRHADAPTVARHLIEQGMPFAIEKPLGLNAEQVKPIVDLARERGLFTAVPFINRYSAIWSELKRLRDDGLAGPLGHAHFRIVNGSPDRYVRDGVAWMLDPTISGGGPLRNLGIHAVDAFLQLTGEATEVAAAATSQRLYGLAIEDFGTALLRSASGVVATVEAGYSNAWRAGSDQEWRIGARGAYLIERAGSLSIATSDGAVTRDVPTTSDHYLRFAGDTLDRFQHGKPAIATVEDCWRAMLVIDRIYAVARGSES